MGDIIPRVTGLFAPLAMKIAGGIMLALGAALALAIWNGNRMEGQRDKAREQLAMCEAQHAITRASLSTLEGELASFVEAGRLRQEEATEAVLEAREAGEDIRRAAQEENRTDWRGQEGL